MRLSGIAQLLRNPLGMNFALVLSSLIAVAIVGALQVVAIRGQKVGLIFARASTLLSRIQTKPLCVHECFWLAFRTAGGAIIRAYAGFAVVPLA